MKRMKTFTTFLLVLLMTFSLIATPASASASVSLIASPDKVVPGEEIAVTITGLTEDQIENGAWIGFFKVGAKNHQFERTEYIFDLPADNVYRVTAPVTYGDYEFRLFPDYNATSYIAVSNTVTVGEREAAFKVSTDKLHPGEEILVTISNIPEIDEYYHAYVGLYSVDAKDNQPISTIYISELPTGNTWKIKAPNKLGKYHFRAFNLDEEHPMGRGGEFEVIPNEPVFKLEKLEYLINEEIKVSYSGEPVSDGAWIGFYKEGSKNNDFIDFAYLENLSNNTFTVKAYESGRYNFRIFMDYDDKSICGTSSTIAVIDEYLPEDEQGTGGGETVIVPNIDEATSWARPEITEAYELNLTTDKILIDFQKDLTREEFCELSIKLYEKMTGTSAEAVKDNPFTDTNNPEILKAYNLGIVKGISADKFGPNLSVTRQEIAVMLLRTLKCVMPELNTKAEFKLKFHDEKEIASWALEAVKFFNANDIIKGAASDGTTGYILPKANTTREQGITLVKRVYDKFFTI
ncbi:hypothetical protein CDQ84_08465 [Clostridium thermosuccinogenes]|uniref:SLH domain-containing protein n=2 Tax=Clostridium thermosuccinogenes TaxID=84032 RepID=A0A2K2FF91_9CLOT|nr:hypothetical protein CDO33_14760 [Pseudoclostridium thermosuccinogenes]PNT97455.1 hypothetical protein CDQ85_08310 [Pseudoclostridium thermosuccinogenes]PNT99487.1 hypothetical protein CDQ84_08465 [Pseudoclostridium thermosuccinogenes]